jgi:hypothetical protein
MQHVAHNFCLVNITVIFAATFHINISVDLVFYILEKQKYVVMQMKYIMIETAITLYKIRSNATTAIHEMQHL